MKAPEDMFCYVGREMFGACWPGDMAEALDVSVRTVQRWQSGKNPIPPGIFSELAAQCDRKSESLGALAKSLRAPQ